MLSLDFLIIFGFNLMAFSGTWGFQAIFVCLIICQLLAIWNRMYGGNGLWLVKYQWQNETSQKIKEYFCLRFKNILIIFLIVNVIHGHREFVKILNTAKENKNHFKIVWPKVQHYSNSVIFFSRLKNIFEKSKATWNLDKILKGMMGSSLFYLQAHLFLH